MMSKVFQSLFTLPSLPFVVLGLFVISSSVMVEARYRRNMDENIPTLLNKVYSEVGHDKFRQSWKEFNSRTPDQQDDFLMSDLSENDLAQLAVDFEHLGGVLSADPNLMELYAQFEHNLNIQAFNDMDRALSNEHTWWGRIKRFLFKKLEKLADEISRRELLRNSV